MPANFGQWLINVFTSLQLVELPLAKWIESLVDWMGLNLIALFDFINLLVGTTFTYIESFILWLPAILIMAVFTYLAWRLNGRGLALFTVAGFFFVGSLGLWEETMITLALILTATLISVFVGVTLGILAAKNDSVAGVFRPVLDLMQTMPSFVYLIPALIFFGMGSVPAVISTVVFSMPPAVRMTSLGIRQVPADIIEAAKAFGSSPRQLLVDVEFPLALPTIMAGINQTIMMALAMVVIAAMIGAGGLGSVVLRGIMRVRVGTGFEGGISIVILAIVLDRISQSLGKSKKDFN
ncbi:MAG TPA: proline/glycine betaine ABC transporter permease [Oscillospiraceae bacterium]|nr:proline/glycine betaine ABC transporter permease [Oscillospiraceae bacterium]